MSNLQFVSDEWEIESPYADPKFRQKQDPDSTSLPELKSPFLDGFYRTTSKNSVVTKLADDLEIDAVSDSDLSDLNESEWEGNGRTYFHSHNDSELSAKDMPMPGNFYNVQYQKGGLLTTAGKAYKTGSKAERLKRAQRINSHPLNRKFWKKPGNAFEQKYFPNGIINFNPVFTCGEEQRRAGKGEKKCFARIWIPVKESYTHPRLGGAIDLPKNVLATILKSTGKMSAAEAEEELLQYETSTSTDQRKGKLKKESNPKVVPYRFICSVIASMTHPDNKNVAVTYGPATGTLIGFRHVLTAAHVLSETWLDGSLLRAEEVFITPMHNSASGLPKVYPDDPESNLLHALMMSKRPLGSFRATAYKIPPQYSTSGASTFDIALVKLGTSVGNLPWRGGRFGYWGSSRWGGGTILSSTVDRERLAKRTVCLSGYSTPRMPQHGINQWKGCGPVDNADIPTRAKPIKEGWMRLGYQIGTEDGHSGSPVWNTFRIGSKMIRKLVAVHSDGGHGIEASSGVLLTPATLNWVRDSR